jgi:hypothetical protein
VKRTGFWAGFRKEVKRQQSLQRLQALKAAGGTVYYIRSGEDGPVKIGWTGGTVESRLRALQTGNSQQLRIVGLFPGHTQAEERQLHAQLSGFRLQGEWFEPQVLGVLARTEKWRPTEGAYPGDEHDPEVLVGPEGVASARFSGPYQRQHEALKIACPTCRAQPGELCRTVIWPGDRVRKAHWERSNQGWEAWMESRA